MRLVLAALADQVDETKHRDWCFPTLQTIQERTQMGRRTVFRALAQLRADGWLAVQNRSGYGSAYRFDVGKLEGHQRPKRERCIHGTRAITAPVPLSTDTRVLNDAEGCLERLPNKEEPAVNQQEEPAIEKHHPKRPQIVAISSKSPTKTKALSSEAEQVYDAYPNKVGRQAALRSIEKAIAAVRKDGHANAVEYLTARIRGWLAKRERDHAAGEFVPAYPNPTTWFNQGRYDDPGNAPKPKVEYVALSEEEARESWMQTVVGVARV